MPSPGGGHSCRIGSGVPATSGADNVAAAWWRGSNCTYASSYQPFTQQQKKTELFHQFEQDKQGGLKAGRCFLSTKHCRSQLQRGRNRRNDRDRSARRQANVLSLVTFFGRAKKVTRLPAGTGEVKVWF